MLYTTVESFVIIYLIEYAIKTSHRARSGSFK